jgi:hypothetical protein
MSLRPQDSLLPTKPLSSFPLPTTPTPNLRRSELLLRCHPPVRFSTCTQTLTPPRMFRNGSASTNEGRHMPLAADTSASETRQSSSAAHATARRQSTYCPENSPNWRRATEASAVSSAAFAARWSSTSERISSVQNRRHLAKRGAGKGELQGRIKSLASRRRSREHRQKHDCLCSAGWVVGERRRVASMALSGNMI